MEITELAEYENHYLPPQVESLFVSVEQGFAGSTGGTEDYVEGDEIEF